MPPEGVCTGPTTAPSAAEKTASARAGKGSRSRSTSSRSRPFAAGGAGRGGQGFGGGALAPSGGQGPGGAFFGQQKLLEVAPFGAVEARWVGSVAGGDLRLRDLDALGPGPRARGSPPPPRGSRGWRSGRGCSRGSGAAPPHPLRVGRGRRRRAAPPHPARAVRHRGRRWGAAADRAPSHRRARCPASGGGGCRRQQGQGIALRSGHWRATGGRRSRAPPHRSGRAGLGMASTSSRHQRRWGGKAKPVRPRSPPPVPGCGVPARAAATASRRALSTGTRPPSRACSCCTLAPHRCLDVRRLDRLAADARHRRVAAKASG